VAIGERASTGKACETERELWGRFSDEAQKQQEGQIVEMPQEPRGGLERCN